MKLTALNAWAIMLQLSGALRQTLHSRSALRKVLLPLYEKISKNSGIIVSTGDPPC